ncbi:MAG TPA: glycosyltransferase N-terminal domain-containing protein, partial [bacterium]|nr:glycosyltransferase N-terminal domain-containing protein [bacterium]
MKLSFSNRLALWLYRILMFLLYIAARVIGLFYPSQGFQERLGFYSKSELDKIGDGSRVWLHAASAGEVNAINPLCVALRKAKPGLQIIITTTSNTGKKLVQENGSADGVFLAPLDM